MGTDLSDDQYELLRRRLEDEVEEKVRGRLVRRFTFVGGVIAATLGYFGYDIVNEFRSEVERIPDTVETSFEAAISRFEEDIEQLEQDISLQIGEITASRKQAARVQEEVTQRLSVLGNDAETLGRLNESVATLLEARRTMASEIDRLETRSAALTEIATELQKLADRLESSEPEQQIAFTEVARNIDETLRVAAAQEARTTVFLQYAGGARATAQELAGFLSDDGFLMPGEERHPGATGLREVRYFHPGDAEAAEALARATEAALSALGQGAIAVEVADFTAFKGLSPKPGVLELWVDLE